jgi:hypothetical protein
MTREQQEVRDRVTDEYTADFGVKVEEVSRNGYEERQEIVKIYATRKDRHRTFDGDVAETSRYVKVAEFPGSVAYEVLVGLAEAHGYDLEAR